MRKVCKKTTKQFGAWQPISTAPKDSTVIDIWTPEDGRLTDYQRTELSPTNVFYQPVYFGFGAVRDATHWMQIPEAPKGYEQS